MGDDIIYGEKCISNVGMLAKKVEAFILPFTQVEQKSPDCNAAFNTWKGDTLS